MVTDPSQQVFNPRVPWVVIVLALLILGAEAASLWERWLENRQLDQANGVLSALLESIKARTEELKTNETRIQALHTRLNDAIVVRKTPKLDQFNEPPSARQIKNLGDPPVIKSFRDNGCQVLSSGGGLGNLSLSYAIGSHSVEFHRLVPLLAQQENSNPFMVCDSLVLERPGSVPPFSVQPTALVAKMSVRLLSSLK